MLLEKPYQTYQIGNTKYGYMSVISPIWYEKSISLCQNLNKLLHKLDITNISDILILEPLINFHRMNVGWRDARVVSLGDSIVCGQHVGRTRHTRGTDKDNTWIILSHRAATHL